VTERQIILYRFVYYLVNLLLAIAPFERGVANEAPSAGNIFLAQVNFVENEAKSAGHSAHSAETDNQSPSSQQGSPNTDRPSKKEIPIVTTENAKKEKIAGEKNESQSLSDSRKNRLDIDGYLNSKYVRLSVDVKNKKTVTGYLFDKSGTNTYVYGEYAYGALHVYDSKGTHYTIVNPDIEPYFSQSK
jgi:hypothetical protein